eukprot:364522-Chlamydomonas_euryale.AAC.3
MASTLDANLATAARVLLLEVKRRSGPCAAQRPSGSDVQQTSCCAGDCTSSTVREAVPGGQLRELTQAAGRTGNQSTQHELITTDTDMCDPAAIRHPSSQWRCGNHWPFLPLWDARGVTLTPHTTRCDKTTPQLSRGLLTDTSHVTATDMGQAGVRAFAKRDYAGARVTEFGWKVSNAAAVPDHLIMIEATILGHDQSMSACRQGEKAEIETSSRHARRKPRRCNGVRHPLGIPSPTLPARDPAHKTS